MTIDIRIVRPNRARGERADYRHQPDKRYRRNARKPGRKPRDVVKVKP